MKKKILFMLALSIAIIFFSCSKKNSTPNVVYSKVSIYKLEILNFPPSDGSGFNWDNALNGNYPDVYFKITLSGTNTSLYSLPVGNRIENLQNASLPESWTGSGGTAFFTLNNLSQAIDIDLYDYDYLTTDQYMGTASFNFTNYTSGSNKYPASVTVTNGLVSIKLYLTWLL